MALKNISAQEASKLPTQDMTILDVRTPGEFRQGHIKGAINIDIYSPDFIDKLKSLDRQDCYILYCRTGNRSRSALNVMAQLGFTDVYHIEDGIMAWIRSGLPLK